MKKWFAICLLPLLAACATTHGMAIDHETEQLDLAGNALVLMSVKMVNGYKPDFQPTPNVVFLEKPMVRGAKDRLNYVIDAEAEQGGSTISAWLFRQANMSFGAPVGFLSAF